MFLAARTWLEYVTSHASTHQSMLWKISVLIAKHSRGIACQCG